MTCVVALKSDGKVYMCADSAGVGGLSIRTRTDPKIYKVGPMLIGFTSSFRMGQLLGYSLTVPDHDPRVPVEKYMATAFIDAVRSTLKTGGYTEITNNEERGGVFLVGYQGRIFQVEGDFQVGEAADAYAAVGCGEDIALGSLYTSVGQEPMLRVLMALEAAAQFSAGVRAPFITEVL